MSMTHSYAADVLALQIQRLHWRTIAAIERASVGADGFMFRSGLADDVSLSGSRLPVMAAAAAAVASLPVLVVTSYFALAPYLAPTSVADRYMTDDNRAQALEVVDVSGAWLGVTPIAMRIGMARKAPYTTADAEAPEGWFEILVALEDRNLGTWRSINGIDVISVFRSIPSAFGRGPGGSSLAQMLVRCMRHQDPSQGGRVSRLKRKVVELAEAPILYRRLGGARSPTFRAWLARHLPLVQGGPGSRMGEPLHGVGLASRVLWGIEPDRLTLAQQAVLAAAVRRKVILAPDGNPATEKLRDARWEIVKARAIRGLELRFPRSPRALAAIAELRDMPAPRPHFLLDAESQGDDFADAANPEARAVRLSRDALILAQGQMFNRLGPEVTSRVAAIRLTIDARANAAFAASLRRRLAAAERTFGNRLTAPLVGVGERSADILAVATKDERIVAYVSTSEEPLFDGALAERNAELRYVPGMSLRPVGSIAKAMLAVRLGREDAPGVRYCNAELPDRSLHNADGSAGLSCRDPRAWVDVSTTFGESLNLPLVWRLGAIPASQLETTATRYRLNLPADVSPRVALPLGLATARPADLLTMMRAIGEGAAGRPARAREATIVSEYRLRGETIWRAFPAGVEFDLASDFSEPGVAPYVRRALTAPLADGGSLAGVGTPTDRVRAHVAKSGTSTAGDRISVRDKYAIGSYRTSGHGHGWLLLVGARHPEQGLGRDLGWRTLWPVVRHVALHGASPSDVGR